jgi:hypothetical protein
MPRTVVHSVGPDDPQSPPCKCCGTTGGSIHRHATRPARVRGLCHACYARDHYRAIKGLTPYYVERKRRGKIGAQ